MAEKKLKPEVKAKIVELESYDKSKWKQFHKKYALDEYTAMLHKIDHDAYKEYMISKGLTRSELFDGHYAVITTKSGAKYVDTDSLYAELRSIGVDIDSLVEKHTKHYSPTKAFSFK